MAEEPPVTIRDLVYPSARSGGMKPQFGGAGGNDDKNATDKAVASTDETWAEIQQYLARIASEPIRVSKIKREILFRLASGEERPASDSRMMLEKYIQVVQPVINTQDEHGTTALMQAAANNRGLHTEVLLQKGANPNIQNKMGETALMWAAAYGAMTPIRIFREKSPIPVEFNAVDNLGWNALMVAAWCGNYMTVQQLAGRTNVEARALDGRSAAAIAKDPTSPATMRTTPQENVLELVLAELTKRNHPRQGGRKRTYRSKTKDKKRSTR